MLLCKKGGFVRVPGKRSFCFSDNYARQTASFLLLLIIGIVCSGCAVKPQHTIFHLYSSKKFSGRSLDGQSILVLPLLTSSGRDTIAALKPGWQIRAIHKKRSELHLLEPDRFEKRIIEMRGSAGLDSLYSQFFRCTIVHLQNDERAWKAVQSDFLMVMRMNYGLTVKSMDRRTIKMMRLEGELWNCKTIEVVWRSAIEEKLYAPQGTDRELITKTIVKLYEALPLTLPGYGGDSW